MISTIINLVFLFVFAWLLLLGNIFPLMRLFFRFVLNVFFRQIKVRGSYKIPQSSAVIFAVAPHANQFVDPLMLICTSGRRVGFLAAKKSMDKLVVGAFARALNSIPVQRPQDIAFVGAGKIYAQKDEPSVICGLNSLFHAQVKFRSVLSFQGHSFEVETIVSDTQVKVKKPPTAEQLAILSQKEGDSFVGVGYKITPHVDQSDMFAEVTRRLLVNQAVGIFPEGGSHDRPELLPLKPGVGIMAFEALATNPELNLSIIPVGLNYFHADRFRSRAVIEYGDPITIPAELVAQYVEGGVSKRSAVQVVMDTINVALKGLTVQAPDFETLMVIQAARRLYQGDEHMDIDANVKLSCKFAYGLEKMKDRPEVKELIEQVKYYNQMLQYYGVQDHQVKNTSIRASTAIYLIFVRSIQLFLLFLVASPMYSI